MMPQGLLSRCLIFGKQLALARYYIHVDETLLFVLPSKGKRYIACRAKR
jgi:hypothetical protein